MHRILTTAASIVAATGLTIGLAMPAQAAMSPKYPVTITLKSTASPMVGSWINLSGRTSKQLHGTLASVQRRQGSGSWKKFASAKVSSSGALSAKIRDTGVGRYGWRFSIAATAKHKASTSSPVTTTGYKYYYLSDLDMVNVAPPQAYSMPVTMGGQTYYHSLQFYMNGNYTFSDTTTAEYNMSYKCTTFVATVGIDDQSLSGSAATDQVLADGALLGSTSVGMGRGVPVQYDIQGVFRLAVTSLTTTPNDLYPDWGDARVLCSGKP
jgi:hypothetical protein